MPIPAVADRLVHKNAADLVRQVPLKMSDCYPTERDASLRNNLDWEPKLHKAADSNKLLMEILDGRKKKNIDEKQFSPPSSPSSRKSKKKEIADCESLDDYKALPKKASNYAIRKVLGKGTFGKVLLAESMGSGELVAIKVIDRKNVKTSKQNISVMRELKLMKLLWHPHIIGIREIIEDKAFVLIVMEHAGGGELFDYILDNGYLSENEARRIFRQILSAVDYCHQNSIIHRDLKPENLLLDDDKNVKLIDFGFGNTFHKDKLLDTFCGSPFYAAPEMIQGIKYTGPEVDIWSLGVILYTLLSGRLPFDGTNLNELYENISSGKYCIPETIRGGAEELISRMLQVDPRRRATMAEIQSHSWVNNVGLGPIENYVNQDRSPLVPFPNQDSLKELVSYGFKEQDCRAILCRNVQQHPIKSLYYLIDEARVRENKLKLQALSATSVANQEIATNQNVSTSFTSLYESTPPESPSKQSEFVVIDFLNGKQDQKKTEEGQSNSQGSLLKSLESRIRGFFTISTVTTKDFGEIVRQIEVTLMKFGIEFTKNSSKEAFDCVNSNSRPLHRFTVEISPAAGKDNPSYKIEMKRIKGGLFEHGRLCRKLISYMEV